VRENDDAQSRRTWGEILSGLLAETVSRGLYYGGGVEKGKGEAKEIEKKDEIHLKATVNNEYGVAYLETSSLKRRAVITSSRLPFKNGDLIIDFDVKTNNVVGIEWIRLSSKEVKGNE
jgi:hypothetical protein